MGGDAKEGSHPVMTEELEQQQQLGGGWVEADKGTSSAMKT